MLSLEDIFNQHQADNYILTCNQANVPIYTHKTNKERCISSKIKAEPHLRLCIVQYTENKFTTSLTI